MKVFISWSDMRSRALAEALRNWLPSVIQAIQPFVSAEDIDKGTRWSSELASELEESRFGIICLTPENLHSPWIHFEAGALSKTIKEKTFVCTYLFDIDPANIQGPLVQFQATKAEEMDTQKLLRTINKALGEQALSETQVDSAFDMWWPKLKERLSNISALQASTQPKRPDREILEEILELVRGITRRGITPLETVPLTALEAEYIAQRGKNSEYEERLRKMGVEERLRRMGVPEEFSAMTDKLRKLSADITFLKNDWALSSTKLKK